MALTKMRATDDFVHTNSSNKKSKCFKVTIGCSLDEVVVPQSLIITSTKVR